jgi:16S rRNA (adenine1518-N6/adenine1519-N6)-dimethyltransferase
LKISNLKTKNPKIKKLFFKIIKAGFSQPRKQLINNLSNGLKIEKEKVKKWLLKNKIEPERRAESLTLDGWLKLTKNYKIN